MARLALLYLTISELLIGAWAQFAPAWFYQKFPGLGWAWVSIDGPFNEHLVRDVGGLNLALGVLGILALRQKTLLLAFAIAALVYQVPHVVYHVVHVGLLSTTSQQIIQTVTLLLGIVAAVIVLLNPSKQALQSAARV